MFKRFVIFIGFAAVLLLGSAGGFAQSDVSSEWNVLIYGDTEILRVKADGFGESIPLPPAAQKIVQGNTVNNMALSPDERYFVFVTEDADNSSIAARLQIADLQEQTCCMIVEAPTEQTPEVVNLGVFSPDGKSLAVNYLNAYFTEPDGLVAILNVENAEIEQALDPWQAFDTPAVFFVAWDQEAIELMPSCFPCGASPDGETMQWDPKTGDITDRAGYTVGLTGSVLEGNHDIVQAVQSEDYPIGQADVMVGPFNVIEYLMGGDFQEPQVVYFNSDNLNLINPEWVIDGNAYLIQEQFAEGGTLVWRDGNTQELTFPAPRLFMVGTPDGWLMTDMIGGHLYQYQWQDGEIVSSDLGAHPNPLKLLSRPFMGASVVAEVAVRVEDGS